MQSQELEQRITALPGWRYEFHFADGVSTPTPSRGVANRQQQRRRYFFERLLSLTGGSLAGRRVLDLGCNAGFWALQAIEAGADFVLGVDGGRSYLDQAELVFEAKGIERSRYRFEHGDVFEHALTEQFDIVLCLALLDHVARPVELFDRIAGVDPELVVIDTEVSRARLPLFEVATLYDAAEGLGDGLVLIPSRSAVEDLAARRGYQARALELEHQRLHRHGRLSPPPSPGVHLLEVDPAGLAAAVPAGVGRAVVGARPARAAGRLTADGAQGALRISSAPELRWSLPLPTGSITCPSTTIGLFQCPGEPGSFASGRGEEGR